MFLAFSFLTETVSKINSFFILLGRGGMWAGVGWVPPCQMRVSKQECPRRGSWQRRKLACDAMGNSEDGAVPRWGERACLSLCMLISHWLQPTPGSRCDFGLLLRKSWRGRAAGGHPPGALLADPKGGSGCPITVHSMVVQWVLC